MRGGGVCILRATGARRIEAVSIDPFTIPVCPDAGWKLRYQVACSANYMIVQIGDLILAEFDIQFRNVRLKSLLHIQPLGGRPWTLSSKRSM
jgi:hypothetical protein